MRKPTPGHSLAEKRPDLLPYWSPRNTCSPWEVYPQSNKPKRLWICPIHGEYEQTCANKYMGKRCKKCSYDEQARKQSVASYEKSLGYLYPDLVKEWSDKNDRSPFEVYPNSHKKYWWKCKEGHEDYLSSCSNIIRCRGCKECKNRKIALSNSTPKNGRSLAEQRPDLILEYSEKNDIGPYQISVKSNKQNTIWNCPQGHPDYLMSCNQRSVAKIGCKICREKIHSIRCSTPIPGHSFGDLYPDLLEEYSPENDKSPFDIKRAAEYMAKWVCSKCGHGWNTYVYQRTRIDGTGSKCPICNKFIPSAIENTLREYLTPFGALPDQTKIGNWEVDILFPKERVVIEYDGSRWHHTDVSYERDKRKSLELLSEGYKVIRVREQSTGYQLGSLDIQDFNYYEIFYKNGYHKKYSSVPTRELLDKLYGLM